MAERHFRANTIIALYVAAVVLIVFFTNPSRNLLHTLGSGLGNLASNGMNSFVDVLSYVRLFAVGLASYYVAKSFNEIGVGLAGTWYGMIVGVVVIVFGHVLNMGMSALSVLVHGIRLNTLEFSGHIGLEWAGIPFRPFARRLPAEPPKPGRQ